MKDKNFIKKILQEQEKKLENPDFTEQVMHRIFWEQEQKKRYLQVVGFMVAIGLMTWMYLAIKPYFEESIQPIIQTWKTQELNRLFSLPYFICFAIVTLVICFLIYDEENNIFKKV